MIPTDQIIPREELPQGADYQLANSFNNFLHKVWYELGYGDPEAEAKGIPRQTPIQQDIANFLQYGGNKLQVLAFRGAAKSYITGPFNDWCLYRDPHSQVLTTSATGAFASANARFAFSLIQNFSWLSHMRPRFDQASSSTDFDVRGAKPAKGTSFAARSITGQITGLRADVIVSDDAETPNTSATPGAREELRQRLGEFGAIIKPGGKTIYLGTPQCEETIYLENELKGYNTLIVPALYPTPEEITRYGAHRLAPCILKALKENPELAGTSTDPTRFSDEDLASRRVEFGEVEFKRQFKMFMEGGADGETPIKLRNIPVLDLRPYDPEEAGTGVPAQMRSPTIADPPLDLTQQGVILDALANDNRLWSPQEIGHFGKPQETVLHVDPSGSGTDETSWCVSGLKTARVFIMELKARLEGHTEDTLTAIAEDAKKWGATTIIVESNFGDGMFESLLRPILKKMDHKCTVEGVKVSKTFKEKRICSVLEPATTAKRVVMNIDIFRRDIRSTAYSAIQETKRRFYRLAYQLTRMKVLRNCLPKDDRCDVLASAVGYWTDRLEVVAEEVQEQERVAAILADFKKSIDNSPHILKEAMQLTELERLLGVDKSDRFANKISHRR